MLLWKLSLGIQKKMWKRWRGRKVNLSQGICFSDVLYDTGEECVFYFVWSFKLFGDFWVTSLIFSPNSSRGNPDVCNEPYHIVYVFNYSKQKPRTSLTFVAVGTPNKTALLNIWLTKLIFKKSVKIVLSCSLLKRCNYIIIFSLDVWILAVRYG